MIFETPFYRIDIMGYKIVLGKEGQKKTICEDRSAFEKVFISIIEPFNLNKEECLEWAAIKGHLNIVKYLVEKGANIHVYGYCPLRGAAENGHLNVMEYLVSMGADIRAHKRFCVEVANENGYFDILNYLKYLKE